MTLSVCRAVCGLPPAVGDDGHAAEQAVERGAALDDEGLRTPGMRADLVEVALTTLPPNTGHFSKMAYCIPGTVTSMPKSGLPVTMAWLSTPGMGVPMMVKSFGSLSVTVARSGGGSAAAAVASAP